MFPAVFASFRCLNPRHDPFPYPPHRTGRLVFPGTAPRRPSPWVYQQPLPAKLSGLRGSHYLCEKQLPWRQNHLDMILFGCEANSKGDRIMTNHTCRYKVKKLYPPLSLSMITDSNKTRKTLKRLRISRIVILE